MTSTFDARIRHLSEAVGEGQLVMGCLVNQEYAQDQHETGRYRHKSGRDHYLGGPLLAHSLELLEKLARNTITSEGSNLTDAAKDVAEDLSGYVRANAPKDTSRLSESGSPYVDSNGVRVWERPPKAPRRIGDAPDGWDKRPPL
jgi:selenocysteine lyase/cysteine desulfurase